MKKILLGLVVSLILVTFVGCSKEDAPDNDQFFAIYSIAAESGSFDGTYEEWLETVKGPQGLPGEDGRDVLLSVNETHILWKYDGESNWTNLVPLVDLIGAKGDKGDDGVNGSDGADGSEIEIRYSEEKIQWKYIDDTIWLDLLPISVLTGSDGADGNNGVNGNDGVDGREIILQLNGDTLQWKYEGDADWIDLIQFSEDSQNLNLTDEEINYLLANYDEDMKSLLPPINLTTLDDQSYDNNCDSTEFEICNTIDNYPMLFGEGYKRYADKQDSVGLISTMMSIISDLMGSYTSEPIVPNQFLSGNSSIANVSGRNNTSVLFEGQLDGSVPVNLPIDIEFTYNLLMYKNVEENTFYVEGVIDVSGGLYFLDLSTFKTTFLLTYSSDMVVESFIYTTDIVGLDEWITIMIPTMDGSEIFSTNLDSVEYFKLKNDELSILYSSNWFDSNVDYYFEFYKDNKVVYLYSNEQSEIQYQVPMSAFSGWDQVDFTEDTKLLSDNEFLFDISLSGVSVLDGTILKTPLETEPTWILSNDYKHFYNNLDELDVENANNIITMRTNSYAEMQVFIGSTLTYLDTSLWTEQSEVYSELSSYQFMNYQISQENTDEAFAKFNLRD